MSVCGDVAAYISGSLLVYVCCTVRKQTASEQRNIHTSTRTYMCSHITTEVTTHQCILIDSFNNCNFSKHE
jgi:hypothetical protein